MVEHVTGIVPDDFGDIAAVATRESGNIEGELFVDCSGSSSLLLGKHFCIPFIDRKDVLFNDTALAARVPNADEQSPIASPALSTAQSAGWIWDIGMYGRRGVGHVYSSGHTSDDQAGKALTDYLASTLDRRQLESVEPRKIVFRPGHREVCWHRNCVAVGFSAGFLEPLEASALALVEFSAATISNELPADREHMEIIAKRFNRRFKFRWEHVVEFLKLHYVLSQRDDSDYWRENRQSNSIPERLQELLKLWRYQAPQPNDFFHKEDLFSSASYQYVLYGMGHETGARPGSSKFDDPALARRHFEENRGKAGKMLQALPANRELLKHIHEHGMSAI